MLGARNQRELQVGSFRRGEICIRAIKGLYGGSLRFYTKYIRRM